MDGGEAMVASENETNDNDNEKLVQVLSTAIQQGDVHTAQSIVLRLAQLHIRLNIDMMPQQIDEAGKEKPFQVTVQVEDRESAGASFPLLVNLSADRIADLKRRVWERYRFPIEVQRWIIGDRIIQEDSNPKTLVQCGVKKRDTWFLYLVPAHSVGLKQEELENSNNASLSDAENESNPCSMSLPRMDSCGLTLAHLNQTLLETNANTTRGEALEVEEPVYDSVGAVGVACLDLRGLEREEEGQENPGMWTCPRCTFANSNESSSVCEVCGGKRLSADPPPRPSQPEFNSPLAIGNRVIYQTDKGQEVGTVKWIGTLSDTEGGHLTVGVEFDNKVGVGNGMYKKEQLFMAKEGHGALIPASNLVKTS